jgi:hypothetical protein
MVYIAKKQEHVYDLLVTNKTSILHLHSVTVYLQISSYNFRKVRIGKAFWKLVGIYCDPSFCGLFELFSMPTRLFKIKTSGTAINLSIVLYSNYDYLG